MPTVSIIIPVKKINDYIRESVPKILELDYPEYEILIFPDDEDKQHSWPKTRIIPSGKVGPAEKRDLALKYAKGEIFAFLDDDAYPRSDWLRMVVKHISNRTVAVGGPALTPSHDDVLQKTSGAVFESFLGAGGARDRYLPIGKSKKIFDWPTVNFSVKRSALEEIGGFDSTFWPGEDTKLCLDLVKAGYDIIYEPKAIVYHHRRSNLLRHFVQIGNYALHRGHFARIYPETSRKPFYFVPALFVLYLIFLLCSFWVVNPLLQQLFAIPAYLYIAGLFIDALIVAWRWKNLLVGLLTIPMILLTHVWYGIRFVQGLLTKSMKH
ncbi:MAG TPA: glycosyltransferase [bacterium]|nr:glycosyltransferase [bacterium]